MEQLMDIEDELDFDTDDIKDCIYAVCITGLNNDGTESGYFKTLQVFSDSDEAITRAWGVGQDNVKDHPDGISRFLVTVEEAVESDTVDEYDFVGTIFKTELIL